MFNPGIVGLVESWTSLLTYSFSSSLGFVRVLTWFSLQSQFSPGLVVNFVPVDLSPVPVYSWP